MLIDLAPLQIVFIQGIGDDLCRHREASTIRFGQRRSVKFNYADNLVRLA
jgi:hypothetical protein